MQQQNDNTTRDRSIIEKALDVNRKTDEVWRKLVIWIWIAAAIYIFFALLVG